MTDLLKSKVFKDLQEELMDKKRKFRISTRSKNLRILRLEKMVFEGDLGALKVISLNVHFCKC